MVTKKAKATRSMTMGIRRRGQALEAIFGGYSLCGRMDWKAVVMIDGFWSVISVLGEVDGMRMSWIGWGI